MFPLHECVLRVYFSVQAFTYVFIFVCWLMCANVMFVLLFSWPCVVEGAFCFSPPHQNHIFLVFMTSSCSSFVCVCGPCSLDNRWNVLMCDKTHQVIWVCEIDHLHHQKVHTLTDMSWLICFQYGQGYIHRVTTHHSYRTLNTWFHM